MLLPGGRRRRAGTPRAWTGSSAASTVERRRRARSAPRPPPPRTPRAASRAAAAGADRRAAAPCPPPSTPAPSRRTDLRETRAAAEPAAAAAAASVPRPTPRRPGRSTSTPIRRMWPDVLEPGQGQQRRATWTLRREHAPGASARRQAADAGDQPTDGLLADASAAAGTTRSSAQALIDVLGVDGQVDRASGRGQRASPLGRRADRRRPSDPSRTGPRSPRPTGPQRRPGPADEPARRAARAGRDGPAEPAPRHAPEHGAVTPSSAGGRSAPSWRPGPSRRPGSPDEPASGRPRPGRRRPDGPGRRSSSCSAAGSSTTPDRVAGPVGAVDAADRHTQPVGSPTVYEGVVQDLIDELGRLPGVGPKSAQRIAFHLLAADPVDVRRLVARPDRGQGQGAVLPRPAATSPRTTQCRICRDPRRDLHRALRRRGAQGRRRDRETREFRGRYHVLGGAISPIEGIGPDDLRIRELMPRLADGVVTELILATDPNLEGEATATYLARLVKPMGLRVTRLASRAAGRRRPRVRRRGHPRPRVRRKAAARCLTTGSRPSWPRTPRREARRLPGRRCHRDRRRVQPADGRCPCCCSRSPRCSLAGARLGAISDVVPADAVRARRRPRPRRRPAARRRWPTLLEGIDEYADVFDPCVAGRASSTARISDDLADVAADAGPRAAALPRPAAPTRRCGGGSSPTCPTGAPRRERPAPCVGRGHRGSIRRGRHASRLSTPCRATVVADARRPRAPCDDGPGDVAAGSVGVSPGILAPAP